MVVYTISLQTISIIYMSLAMHDRKGKQTLFLLVLMLTYVIILTSCVSSPPSAPGSGPEPAPTSPQQEGEVWLPNPPSNLTAEVISRSSIGLVWSDNSDDEDGFKVYRDNSLIATVGRDITAYSDTDVGVGNTFQYALKAYNDGGESAACSCDVRIAAPALNVRIDYIGVIAAQGKDDFDDYNGEVKLAIVVTDGQVTEKWLIPPAEGNVFDMGDFETTEINQRVFHTASIGDYLKVSIIAYDIDSKTETLDYLSVLEVLGEILGVPGVGTIKQIYSVWPEEDDPIGYYQYVWKPDENWGIGQYEAKGHDDLRVWFQIYSDIEPPLISKPSLIPDVNIQSVNLPSEVKRSSFPFLYWYTHTLTLVNNESIDVWVDWQANSSVTGDFAGGNVRVPANDCIIITEDYFYESVGITEVTYTISHNGRELDSWSGTVNVIP